MDNGVAILASPIHYLFCIYQCVQSTEKSSSKKQRHPSLTSPSFLKEQFQQFSPAKIQSARGGNVSTKLHYKVWGYDIKKNTQKEKRTEWLDEDSKFTTNGNSQPSPTSIIIFNNKNLHGNLRKQREQLTVRVRLGFLCQVLYQNGICQCM